jgi:hypothetical protein
MFLGSYGQTESNGDIDKRTRKITHRIAELFSLIKENQSDRSVTVDNPCITRPLFLTRYITCAERINSSVQDMIRLFDKVCVPSDVEPLVLRVHSSLASNVRHETDFFHG